MMMDGNAPTHERRKLVKTYKNVLPRNRTVVCGETYSTNIIKWSRKTATDVINPEKKRGTLRETERNKSADSKDSACSH